MPGYNSNFRVNRSGSGFANSDFSSIFVRKDYFSEGGLWVWGHGSYGLLGNLANNYYDRRSSPIQTVAGGTNWRSVDVGRFHMAAIKTDGTLWTWGAGQSGQLGNNSSIAISSPVQTISGGTNWKSVSASDGKTAAIKTDGTLWVWGENNSGYLGNNLTSNISSPVQTIAGGTNWKDVCMGRSVSAATKTDGTLWVWGRASVSGGLGTNSTVDQSSPVQTVSGGTNWKQISVGAYHTTAIKTDGTLWAWGRTGYGLLGNDISNFSNNISSPVQTISGGTNWKQVGAGDSHTTAIKTDGTLWIWGNNNAGQLGNDLRTNASSPIQTVSGGSNWRSVSANYRFTSAIKTDGTLWLWGRQGFCFPSSVGVLGDNSTVCRSSPVQTVAGGTNWRFVTGGYRATAAIRENCW